jgi:hypothetical protein
MLATRPLGADRADLRINFFLAKNYSRFSDSEMLFGCFRSELWRRGRIFLDLTWSSNRLKQHSSRHRAPQCESQRGGYRESDHQAKKYRGENPPRTKRRPQYDDRTKQSGHRVA